MRASYFIRQAPIRSRINCLQQFSNQGNRIESLSSLGSWGSQVGRVNTVLYALTDEPKTQPLVVTQGSLKIRHKQDQICVYLTAST